MQANSPIEHVTIFVEIELAIGGEQLVIVAVLDQQEDNKLSHVHAAELDYYNNYKIDSVLLIALFCDENCYGSRRIEMST